MEVRIEDLMMMIGQQTVQIKMMEQQSMKLQQQVPAPKAPPEKKK